MRGTLPWEGSKVGRVRCRFWCRECARGSDPLAHLHAVSGGAGAAIGVGKGDSCSEQMSHLQVPVIAKTLFSKAIKFCFDAMLQQTKTDSRF